MQETQVPSLIQEDPTCHGATKPVRAQSCLTLPPYGLLLARFLFPWDFPSKNTGVGCHFLLQMIFLAQVSDSCLIGWRILYCWATWLILTLLLLLAKNTLPLSYLWGLFSVLSSVCFVTLFPLNLTTAPFVDASVEKIRVHYQVSISPGILPSDIYSRDITFNSRVFFSLTTSLGAIKICLWTYRKLISSQCKRLSFPAMENQVRKWIWKYFAKCWLLC